MEDPVKTTCYTIDGSDMIVGVGGDWDQFARENESPSDLFSGSILHRNFWDFISGEALRHVYRGITARVRAGETLAFSFRCDSPALRRYINMHVTSKADGGIEFVMETVRIEEREFQHLFDARAPRTDGIVVACSWCNRLRTSMNVWQEPEDAVDALSLFAKEDIPALSHGLCEECYRSVTEKIQSK